MTLACSGEATDLPTHLRLVLELDSREDPIRGRLTRGREPSLEFTGWLGFAAALGEVLKPVEDEATA